LPSGDTSERKVRAVVSHVSSSGGTVGVAGTAVCVGNIVSVVVGTGEEGINTVGVIEFSADESGEQADKQRSRIAI
jgi:hypothetical protein